MTVALRLLWPHVRPHRIRLIVAVAAMLGEIATALLSPIPLQRAVDLLVRTLQRPGPPPRLGDPLTWELGALAGALLAIAILDALFTYVDGANTARVSQLATTDLRRALFNHLQRLSLSFHRSRDTRTGDLQLRLSGDISNLEGLIDGVLGSLVTNAGTAALMLLGLFIVDLRLGVIVLVGSAPVYLLSQRYGRRVRQAVREARKQEGRVSAMLAETLSAASLVQTLGREEHESGRMVEATEAGLDFSLRATEAQARLQPAVTVATSAVIALVLLVAAALVVQGSLTLGLLTLALSYTRGTFASFRGLAKLPIQIQRSSVSADRLAELFGQVPEVRDPVSTHPQPLPSRPLAVEFDHVSFGYQPGQPVLRDFSWRIEAGSRVALVGPTGAGKSSALSLVPRLYDVWGGRVLVGGRDVRTVPLAELRNRVTLVLQDALLFRDTVWNNIAYGRPGATASEILEAARTAGVSSFIDTLEDGFDTMVSERGATLSGGQKQCVALARALLRDSPVVIMDEPTSNLDAASEQLVVRGLERLMAGRTAIVIAHRFSTIANADVVAVVEAGRVVELGPPAKLLDDRGLFARLSHPQGVPALGGSPSSHVPEAITDRGSSDVARASFTPTVPADPVSPRVWEWHPRSEGRDA